LHDKLREDRENADEGRQDDHCGSRGVRAAADSVGILGDGESGCAVGTAFCTHSAESVCVSNLATCLSPLRHDFTVRVRASCGGRDKVQMRSVNTLSVFYVSELSSLGDVRVVYGGIIMMPLDVVFRGTCPPQK
jgi:hypothetical protein